MTTAMTKRKGKGEPNAVLTPNEFTQAVQRMDEIAQQFSVASIHANAPGSFGEAMALAEGMHFLREMLTDEMVDRIRELEESELGYFTDKDPKRTPGVIRYDNNTIREVVISAVLNGLKVCGNQFNAISGKCYITKNGCRQKIKDVPGLTDLSETYGLPRISEKGDGREAQINAAASWKLNGEPMSIGYDPKDPCTLSIRVNKGMGADAIVGKAERKLLWRIYQRSTGSTQALPDGEVADLDAPRIETKAQARLGRFQGAIEKQKSLGAGNSASAPALPAADKTPEEMFEPGSEG